MYYEIWEKFDETASQYIPLDKLCEFVEALEEPLHLPHDSFFKVVSMQIPICEDDRVHCVDILDALTKNFLGTEGDTGDLGEISKKPNRKDYVVISNTLKRQRENYCARVIQARWRDFVVKRKQLGLSRGPPKKNDFAPPPFPGETIITIENADADRLNKSNNLKAQRDGKHEIIEMDRIKEENEDASSKIDDDDDEEKTKRDELEREKKSSETSLDDEVELRPDSNVV
jgi:hypothetical protein